MAISFKLHRTLPPQSSGKSVDKFKFKKTTAGKFMLQRLSLKSIIINKILIVLKWFRMRFRSCIITCLLSTYVTFRFTSTRILYIYHRTYTAIDNFKLMVSVLYVQKSIWTNWLRSVTAMLLQLTGLCGAL